MIELHSSQYQSALNHTFVRELIANTKAGFQKTDFYNNHKNT